MARATSGDIEIEYDVQSFYDDDPPLVLIAGLGCQLIFFEDEFVQGLVDRAFRVIRMDNRDVGLSTWLDDDPVDLGDVYAALAAGEGGQQTFEAVRKPNLVQQEIYRAMEAGEHRQFQRMGEATASAFGGNAPGPSIPEQIEQLDALRRAGTITDDEFEAKKRDLLDRM